jgi:hypothetical protein
MFEEIRGVWGEPDTYLLKVCELRRGEGTSSGSNGNGNGNGREGGDGDGGYDDVFVWFDGKGQGRTMDAYYVGLAR